MKWCVWRVQTFVLDVVLYCFSADNRVLLRDNRALRFGVGPYGETVLGGRRDDGWRVTKNQDFEVLSTVGVRAEVAFELGSLVLGVGYKCSLRDKNVIDDLQTFSLGVGYRF